MKKGQAPMRRMRTARRLGAGLGLTVTLGLGGCGLPSDVLVLLPDERNTGSSGSVRVATASAGEVDLCASYAALDTKRAKAMDDVFIVKRTEVDRTFAPALNAAPSPARVFILYFQSGQTEVDEGSRPNLEAAIRAAGESTTPDVSVIGHADATGSPEQNDAISLQRARMVRDAIVGAGIPAGAIEVGSHGASNPYVVVPPGQAEPRNRRVEITVR